MEEIKKMKFSVLTEKGHAEVRERNLPEMGPDDVLVKQLACNICTTDYGQWLGLREHQGYPMAGGHEESRIVMAIGEDVKDLKPGDHVAVAYDSCGKCEACRRGQESTFHSTTTGSFATSCSAPANAKRRTDCR